VDIDRISSNQAKNASIFCWSHQQGNIFHVAFETDVDRNKALENGANPRYKSTYSVPHDMNTYRVVFKASSPPNVVDNNHSNVVNNNHSNVINNNHANVVDNNHSNVVNNSHPNVVDNNHANDVGNNNANIVGNNHSSVLDVNRSSVVDNNRSSVLDVNRSSVVDNNLSATWSMMKRLFLALNCYL
jgi:hypothetical protein